MYKQQLEEFFESNRESLINDVCRLVSIESERDEAGEGMPYGKGPVDVLAEALKMAQGMGFAVTNYDNYVGAVDFNDLDKQLDMLAHLDVVPAGEGWTVTKPYEPVVQDGCIYGRGTADDKGPAVAALYAMKAVRDLGVPLKKNVRLILGTDEECGSSDIKHYYKTEEEAPMTFSPDADFPVINIEKGGLKSSFESSWTSDESMPRILSFKCGIKTNVIPEKAVAEIEGFDQASVKVLAEKAAAQTHLTYGVEKSQSGLTVTAIGKGGHAAMPAEANNALTGMLHFLSMLPAAETEGFKKLRAVSRIFPHGDWAGKAAGVDMEDEESGALTICLNILEYDETGLKGTFDCRAPICSNNANVRDVLRDKLLDAGIVLENNDMFPPHYVPSDSEFVKTLLKCYEQYTGQKGKTLAIGGGTYVHSLKNGVAFGCAMPGTDNNLHGADEFVVIEHLIVSAKIFAQVIIDLCA